jgi:hypothetical protein
VPGSKRCAQGTGQALQLRRRAGGQAAAGDADDDANDDANDTAAFPALLAGLAGALDAARPGAGASAARKFAKSNPAVTSLAFMAWLADACV